MGERMKGDNAPGPTRRDGFYRRDPMAWLEQDVAKRYLVERIIRLLMLYLAIAVVVILSREAVWALWPKPPSAGYSLAGFDPDYMKHYYPDAVSAAHGEGFTDPQTHHLDTRYPPGYSAYLAGGLLIAQGTGVNFVLLRLAMDNLLVVPLTCLGLIALWRMLGMPIAWAICSALAYALYPPYVWSSLIPTTIPLFTFLLVWTCVAWAAIPQSRRPVLLYVACGVGMGLSMLVWPASVLLPFFAALLMLLRRVPLKYAVCVILSATVVIAPWVESASVAEHHLVPLSTGGPPTLRDGMTRFPGNAAAQAFLQEPKGGLTAGRFVLIAAKEVIFHPLASVELWGNKFLHCWYATDVVGGRVEWLLAAMNAVVLGVAAWGWTGLRRDRRVSPQRTMLVYDMLWLLAYFWMISTAVLSILRYMVPVAWVPIAYGVFGVCMLWQRRAGARAAAGTTGIPRPEGNAAATVGTGSP